MQQLSSQRVSELLFKWRDGDPDALQALVPLVYNELRRMAHVYLRQQRPDHTLRTTALVHEAYLHFADQKAVHFENRHHFFAVAALSMRQILVQYARSRNAAKRNGGCKLSFDDTISLFKGRRVELVALDDALNDLARLNAQQSQIVELRFFGGLSIEETAKVLGISPVTVKRHWALARIWLHHEMTKTVEA